MNGAGNDFIIINNIIEKLPLEKFSDIAINLCERHLGIGADGLMVVEKSSDNNADYKMIFYNSDGSIGEMCGNGARCICRYGYENKLCKNDSLQIIETKAGKVKGERIDDSLYKIRLNDPSNIKLDICVCGMNLSYIELGNPGIPHAVIEVKNLREKIKNSEEKLKLFDLGRKLRYAKEFPKGANINFYDIEDKNTIYELTYERGVEDFTYACGTGTGSVVTILNMKKLVSNKNVQVMMKGGVLTIDINKKDDKIIDLYLTGPTEIVCKGECDVII